MVIYGRIENLKKKCEENIRGNRKKEMNYDKD